MTFISYAQNFEDVMLWRALKDVGNGFYVDVGAQDPQLDSVTKAFYDRGWRGINIEPVDEWFAILNQERERDINLKVAAGNESGKLTLYEIPDTGLSTQIREIAERHHQDRGVEIHERRVPVRTLTEICETYHVAPIHFLKIDAEGAEQSVLEGLDLHRIRPWILVVESTLPNNQTESFEEWEPQVLGADYAFAYFDGLNRYYVRNENADLIDSFDTPPNYFDDFIRWQEHCARLKSKEVQERNNELQERIEDQHVQIEKLDQKLANAQAETGRFRSHLEVALKRIEQLDSHQRALESQISRIEDHRQELEAQATQYSSELTWMYDSHSWKLTTPLRYLTDMIRQALTVARRPLDKIKKNDPEQFPRIQEDQPDNHTDTAGDDMPTRVRQIHRELTSAIEHQRGKKT